ncbi:MAG TPA: hypothetical protein VGO98_01485 [Candidatus Saccharimonadales bacterium]|jgi:hypothetical protein|nr:hypothetical protein [Candidatus Saccharimonadales bacterium]
MDTQTDNRYWLQYIETMRQMSQPVKLDAILEKRMQAFLNARQAKVCQPEE